jgi:hypothetical protein
VRLSPFIRSVPIPILFQEISFKILKASEQIPNIWSQQSQNESNPKGTVDVGRSSQGYRPQKEVQFEGHDILTDDISTVESNKGNGEVKKISRQMETGFVVHMVKKPTVVVANNVQPFNADTSVGSKNISLKTEYLNVVNRAEKQLDLSKNAPKKKEEADHVFDLFDMYYRNQTSSALLKNGSEPQENFSSSKKVERYPFRGTRAPDLRLQPAEEHTQLDAVASLFDIPAKTKQQTRGKSIRRPTIPPPLFIQTNNNNDTGRNLKEVFQVTKQTVKLIKPGTKGEKRYSCYEGV